MNSDGRVPLMYLYGCAVQSMYRSRAAEQIVILSSGRGGGSGGRAGRGDGRGQRLLDLLCVNVDRDVALGLASRLLGKSLWGLIGYKALVRWAVLGMFAQRSNVCLPWPRQSVGPSVRGQAGSIVLASPFLIPQRLSRRLSRGSSFRWMVNTRTNLGGVGDCSAGASDNSLKSVDYANAIQRYIKPRDNALCHPHPKAYLHSKRHLSASAPTSRCVLWSHQGPSLWFLRCRGTVLGELQQRRPTIL